MPRLSTAIRLRLALVALATAIFGSLATAEAAADRASEPPAPVRMTSPRPCYRGFPGRRQPALGVRCYRPASTPNDAVTSTAARSR